MIESCEVALGLAYELHDPSLRGALEIDGSCVKFDRDGRCLGAVYFADKEDTESGITHYGLHTGELGSFAHGDDDQIRFNLSKIQPHIHVLFFVVTLFGEGLDAFTSDPGLASLTRLSPAAATARAAAVAARPVAHE